MTEIDPDALAAATAARRLAEAIAATAPLTGLAMVDAKFYAAVFAECGVTDPAWQLAAVMACMEILTAQVAALGHGGQLH